MAGVLREGGGKGSGGEDDGHFVFWRCALLRRYFCTELFWFVLRRILRGC